MPIYPKKYFRTNVYICCLDFIEQMCYYIDISKPRLLKNTKGIQKMITINTDRTAYIPESDRHIGFENDNLVETRYFEITDEDISDFSFKLDIAETLDIIDLEKVTLDDGKCVLVWEITSGAVGTGGIIRVQLRAFDASGEKVWHSQIMEFVSDASVNGEKQIDDERSISEFEQLEIRVTGAVNSAEASANAALTQASIAKNASDSASLSAKGASRSALEAEKHKDSAESYCVKSEEYAEAAEAALDGIKDIFGNGSDPSGKAEEHYENKENPHGVTASQTGAYTKEEADGFFASKSELEGMYEDSPVLLTDFEYSLDHEDPDYSGFVKENYVTSPFAHVITLHCKGKTLSFSAETMEASEYSYAKMTVNGECLIDNTNGILSCKVKDLFMTEDIIFELKAESISFSGTTSKEINGYTELKKQIGRIDSALDEILEIQESLM